MVRLLALSLFLASIGSGCCHCYQRTYYPGNGPLAAALAGPVRSAVACSGGGCGEVYWDEWNSDPPDDYDPCCGEQWVGQRGNRCSGLPHTRLCIWGLLERMRGIRGDCYGYCCDGGCGPGGGCNGTCGTGGGWSDGEMMSDDGYESAGQGEYDQPAPAMRPAPGMTPGAQDWEHVPTPAVPGMMDPQSRGPVKSRSVNNKRYGRAPLRTVSHEEEAATETSDALETSNERGAPPLMQEVLPDPRTPFRR